MGLSINHTERRLPLIPPGIPVFSMQILDVGFIQPIKYRDGIDKFLVYGFLIKLYPRWNIQHCSSLHIHFAWNFLEFSQAVGGSVGGKVIRSGLRIEHRRVTRRVALLTEKKTFSRCQSSLLNRRINHCINHCNWEGLGSLDPSLDAV